MQFSVDNYTEVIPRTKSGIAAYLSSGLIKGIGKTTADLIVAKFGIDALDIIENDPKRLLEIKRITEKRLEQILDSYACSKGLKEIMTFLGSYGVTPNKAKKIQEHFGSRAIDVIQHSPYLLCEISGFGFKTVDEIARNINFQPADPLRLEGGISFVLEEAKDSGHLFLLKEDLLERAFTLLTERVPEGIIDEAILILLPLARQLQHHITDCRQIIALHRKMDFVIFTISITGFLRYRLILTGHLKDTKSIPVILIYGFFV